MPDLLPDKLTAISKAEALSALYAGWISLFGKAPASEDSLRVLMSQWALETGWGKAMHNFNFGNVKSVNGDGYDYCLFRCFEKENGKIVWYDPPSPACRFRAFKTAAEGAEDYLKILYKRFNLSWPAVLTGDPAKFSHALKQQGYYTADESQYTSTLSSIFKGLKGQKIDKTGAPAPGKGSLEPTDTPAKPVVTKNIVDGVGAEAARIALTRSLSAHGWTLDGGNAWTIADPLVSPDTLHAIKLLPGDLLTIVTASGPRNGRAATVILAEGEYADSSSAWCASASGPKQQVVIESLKFEPSPRDFDASLKDGGKPLATWKDGEKRPASGHAWIVGILRTSTVQRGRVDKMTDAQRTKLKINKGDAQVTPGTVLSRSAKQKPGDATVQHVPIPDDTPVAEKKGKANASGASIKPPLTGLKNDEDIPPPVQIDSHTVKIHIGTHAGRVGFTVKLPPPNKPAAAAGSTPLPPKADGKRDTFIHAAMNFVGTAYLANSADPSKGLDGVGLLSICLTRVGILKKGGDPLTVDALNGMYQLHGGTVKDIPDNILPGDIAWFGSGTHDVDAQQHPMIYLGGGHVLGPIGDAGPNGGAVQVIALDAMPEHFAGWAHIEDLGTDTEHTEHPGPAPKSTKTVTPAILPAGPAQRYDALKAVATSQKGTWSDDKGKVNLVAVPNLHDRSVIVPTDGGWNDTVFAAFLDDDGNKCCIELRASINPGTDKDSTGTWQLMNGSYSFKLGAGDGVDSQTLKPDGDVEGWLDEDGAGSIRMGEMPPADSGAGSGDGGGSGDAAPASGDDSSSDAGASDTTTAAPDSTTTAAAADTTTAAPAETTTAAAEATTTAAPEATTTAAAAATTTAAPAATTTAAPAATTTAAPAATTTAAPATTTAAPATTTTAAPAATTTAVAAATTTAAPAATTTAAAAATTTAAPAATTTAAPPAATTTAAPAATTTAKPAATTTAHPPTTTTANNQKVSSSNITVNGKHFVDWFNGDFKPQYPGNHPTLVLWKKPAPMFPSSINKANFCTVFDNVKYLWADQLTVPEFLGFFGIFYNETGGSFKAVGEQGGQKYCFEPTAGGKASYNKSPNRLAGDQLKAAGAISSDDDVAAWNSTTYPSNASADVIAAAANCDFYKYRGHGYIQTTWRNNYQRDADPALAAAGYGKKCDDMTLAEMEKAILTDPKVNLAMVKSFFKNMGNQFSKVNQDPPVWFDTGRAVSGQKPYGDLYQWRCETIFAAMKKAGFQLK